MNSFYRFQPTLGYILHLWKSATRQDHASLKKIISRYLPSNGVAIDVGAHGGQITRLLSGIAKAGFVVAVEPSGYTRSILRLVLWLRRCRNVIVVAAGLGSDFSLMLIRTPIKRHSEMGYGLANLIDAGLNSIVEPVAVVTLDRLVERLALTRVDFIKADIEGYEAELISGAHNVIKQFRPVIFMEMDEGFLHRAGASLDTLWQEMTALRYAPYPLRNGILEMMAARPVEGDILWLPT